MELYRTYPKLCTLLCCLEITIYAGQLLGWSSVMYVLKEEGFYMELCESFNGHAVNDVKCIEDIGQSTSKTNASLFDVAGGTNINNSLQMNDTTGASHNIVSKVEKCLSKVPTVERVLMQDVRYNIDVSNNSSDDIYSKANASNGDVYPAVKGDEEIDGSGKSQGCYAQDAQLNLWFSVAICVSYISCSFMGPILHRIGMRPFRTLSILMYVIGTLSLGLASPAYSWLIPLGLTTTGMSGMAVYATNIQVSYLFPDFQSTITSLFVGLFDVSTIVIFLMKVAFDAGIPRKYYYIGLAALHVVLVGTNTFLFLPNKNIRTRTSRGQEKNELKKADKTLALTEENAFITKDYSHNMSTVAIYKPLLSLEYILHVYWMCCQCIRFVSFLGFFNTWIETRFNGHVVKENYYLALFSYVTMAAVITAITAGLLHDCQRRKYLRKAEYQRRRLPIILPLTVTSLLSVLVTALTFVKLEIFLNFIFIIFTFYRAYVYSYEITFLNDIYPLQSFPVLFGVVHSFAGLSGMLQSPLYEWYKSSNIAPTYVNYFLMGLGLSSLAHPLYVWYNCRRHKNSDTPNINNMEIYI